LDSKSLTRRDAQQLVRDGQVAKAIQQYEEAISGGAGAPYDFVYLGDLCIRGDRQLEAVGHYEEAIAGYTRLGLHRNSIALWRKILRLDGTRLDAYARMGDAYAAEQLVGDALHAYFVYLERAWEKEHGSEAFGAVVKRVEEMAPQRAEYAIRLSEFLVQSDQPEAAASVLSRAAEIAQAAGMADLAADLRDRAQRLEPQGASAAASESWPTGEETGVDPAAEILGWDEEPGDASAAAADDTEVEVLSGRSGAALHYGEIDLNAVSASGPVEKDSVDRGGLPIDHHAIETCLAEGRLEEALQLCDEAACTTEMSSLESAELSQLRGRALARMGRRSEAIQAMRLALQEAGAEPGTGRWAYELANELEAVGELDEARSLLREAVERDPDFNDAAVRLAMLERGAA
jgi:tetratricopeptide (TPR) repeat protein